MEQIPVLDINITYPTILILKEKMNPLKGFLLIIIGLLLGVTLGSFMFMDSEVSGGDNYYYNGGLATADYNAREMIWQGDIVEGDHVIESGKAIYFRFEVFEGDDLVIYADSQQDMAANIFNSDFIKIETIDVWGKNSGEKFWSYDPGVYFISIHEFYNQPTVAHITTERHYTSHMGQLVPGDYVATNFETVKFTFSPEVDSWVTVYSEQNIEINLINSNDEWIGWEDNEQAGGTEYMFVPAGADYTVEVEEDWNEAMSFSIDFYPVSDGTDA
jgi:hypothetical protein